MPCTHMDPLGRVARLERHKPQRNREVDEIEIHILEAEVTEAPSACSLDMLRRVVRVP